MTTMKKRKLSTSFINIIVFTIGAVLYSFTHASEKTNDPLPSWNDVQSKQLIISFVSGVTQHDGKDYVPPSDRIAIFDNDGTLWTEKPLYIHFSGVIAHMEQQIKADPDLAKREPYATVANKDSEYFSQLYEHSEYETLASQLLAIPFGGMTEKQFSAWGIDFLAKYKHPRFNVGVKDLVYQPMLELMRYLEANQFTVYIFTADESAFLKLISQKLYGIPPEQVHGTMVKHSFITRDGKPALIRDYNVSYVNNWDAKPRLIKHILGKKPIFAAGNSNGDQHMLQYTALNGGLSLLIHHTDAGREYQYDKHTDKVMPLAIQEGWSIVDMKKDWKTVFPD